MTANDGKTIKTVDHRRATNNQHFLCEFVGVSCILRTPCGRPLLWRTFHVCFKHDFHYCFIFCLQLDKIAKEREILDELREIESLLTGS